MQNDSKTGRNTFLGNQFNNLYARLRTIAAGKIAGEKHQVTMHATVLVHEAFLRLRNQSANTMMKHTGYFIASASETMRRILIDRANKRKRVKHGGNYYRVDIDSVEVSMDEPISRVELLKELLTQMSASRPRQAKVLDLKFFHGMQEDEIAEFLCIERRTVQRDWQAAKAWLMSKLQQGDA